MSPEGAEGITGNVVVAILMFVFPAVYEAGWRPIVRMLIVWGMIVVLIILVRMPMPAEFPRLPALPNISQMLGSVRY